MFIVTMAVAPFWMTLVGALSAFLAAFAFWKPVKSEVQTWGSEHDPEAEWQKLRARLGNGKD